MLQFLDSTKVQSSTKKPTDENSSASVVKVTYKVPPAAEDSGTPIPVNNVQSDDENDAIEVAETGADSCKVDKEEEVITPNPLASGAYVETYHAEHEAHQLPSEHTVLATYSSGKHTYLVPTECLVETTDQPKKRSRVRRRKNTFFKTSDHNYGVSSVEPANRNTFWKRKAQQMERELKKVRNYLIVYLSSVYLFEIYEALQDVYMIVGIKYFTGFRGSQRLFVEANDFFCRTKV